MHTRNSQVLLFTLVGATPGLVMVLLAQFVIQGEMELTVGAPGILIAVGGAVAGLIYGLWRRSRTPVA